MVPFRCRVQEEERIRFVPVLGVIFDACQPAIARLFVYRWEISLTSEPQRRNNLCYPHLTVRDIEKVVGSTCRREELRFFAQI